MEKLSHIPYTINSEYELSSAIATLLSLYNFNISYLELYSKCDYNKCDTYEGFIEPLLKEKIKGEIKNFNINNAQEITFPCMTKFKNEYIILLEKKKNYIIAITKKGKRVLLLKDIINSNDGKAFSVNTEKDFKVTEPIQFTSLNKEILKSNKLFIGLFALGILAIVFGIFCGFAILKSFMASNISLKYSDIYKTQILTAILLCAFMSVVIILLNKIRNKFQAEALSLIKKKITKKIHVILPFFNEKIAQNYREEILNRSEKNGIYIYNNLCVFIAVIIISVLLLCYIFIQNIFIAIPITVVFLLNLIFSIVFDDNSKKVIKILPLVMIATGFYTFISILIYTINSTAINAADTIIMTISAIIILSLSLYFAYAIKGIKEMNKNNDTYMSLMMCSEYKSEAELKTLSGKITADNISIITADGMELLKNISLNISPNRLTLLQSNGICGKSLLLRAIKGDYIIKGKFLYDNYDYNEIRNSIQNNIFYTDKIEIHCGTIRENLSSIHTDSEILRAANMTGLIEYISQHNGGLNYEIFDKNSISTTEAILIEMTRILIKKPSIALIDNITTPLSPALEKTAFNALTENSITVIAVTGNKNK